MTIQRHAIALVLALLTAATASAQDALLDLISTKAAAALAIRNVKELKKKGETFVEDANLKMPMRPSQFFEEGYKHLKIQGVVDENAPAAIVLIDPESVGLKRGGIFEFLNLLVAVVPFKDRDKIGARFGFKVGELKPGKVFKTNRPGNDFGKVVYARGKHLFIGNVDVAVKAAATGKSVAKTMTASRRKKSNQSDLFLHVTRAALREVEGELVRSLERESRKLEDKDEVQLLGQVVKSVKALQQLSASIRIDNGFQLNLLHVFDKNNKAAATLLSQVSGNTKSNLYGLPNGNVLIAQAFRNDGTTSSRLARMLFRTLLENPLQTQQIISAAEQPLFISVFDAVWQHLKGTRAALYVNRDSRKGVFSFVAVLDTEDAAGFLGVMKTMAFFADGSNLKLNPKTKEPPKIDMDKLVRDLGHRSFRVRTRAALKFRLIGEPALLKLRTAFKSKDLETSVKARRLHDEITRRAAQRRKDLLAQNPFRRIRPTFALIPKAEKRNSDWIHVLRVKLPEKDQKVQPILQKLLGPQWHNMRLAPHGKQVAVLLGSDVTLLDETLKNLRAKKNGLAMTKNLARFYKQSDDTRRFELHVSVARLLNLIDPEPALPAKSKATAALSSLGLSVKANRLQLDLNVPISEVRVMAKKVTGGR